MTLETASDSASKQDQEKDQKGTGGTQSGQQPGEDHQNALEQFPAAAAHSTPLKSEKNADKDWDKEAAAAKQLEYQQLEDDKVSQRSVSSKLSKSPLKSAKRPKNMQAKVILLDGSEYTCEVEKRSKGQVLFDKVCEHLNLLEKDYFGLVYRDLENQKNWLDPAKEIKKQTRNGSWQFSFNVKFYPPDPSQLSEDITRYYLCLQLRDDIVSGRLPCSFVTLALLGSYTVQSELGDYEPDEYSGDYVSEFRFAPNQTRELEDKVVDLHKSYRGMTPAEAEMHFLENAKKLSMYGVDLHHAKDSEGVEIMLGVCASGLLIYRDRLRINRFAWPKVLKISYKRNNFYIKIRPGEFEQFESTIGFKLPNHRAAKRLWKVCVEHHTFFRLLLPEAPPKKFLTLGSKFRYSGRTQAQTRRASALIDRPAPYFERSSSKRYTMSRSLDGASVNENHDMYMKDSVSATEVGTGPYITTKGASQTNLIASATPEKKVEEEKKEEEEEEQRKKVEVVTTVTTTIRHDAKTDSEQTDTAADGETTATENSLIKRIKGENVYVKHSNLMLEEFDRDQEELMKHQTNISELKRTFLETSTDTAAASEWEKRLSSSPVRLAVRQEEAPMIEPLVPEEQTKEEKEEVERRASLEKTSYSMLESQTKQSSGDKLMDGSDIYSLLESTRKPSEFIGEVTTTSQNWAQKIERNTEWETSGIITEKEDTAQRTKEKVVQGTFGLEETGDMHAVGDAAHLTAEQASTIIASGLKGSEGTALTEEAAKEEDEVADGSVASYAQEKQHGKTTHDAALLDCKPLEESPLVKTEIITFGTIAEGEKPDVSTKDVPVIHTETKTITYESSEMVSRPDTDPGVLMSAQTITSETLGTTTTTHITKTVKGGISETRIEKRIVITGDADIDHDQALAQAIKEAKEQHPDMSVTKVVVHKETEITPEDGED
ncbi:band 4.1-like protein 3 isoform X10 [Bufo gargarizans]|uniref:band 4.1-like protein 3 isoform X10 n=1 Tax=Bufo gargarizans TaxID=30331 RepID=UPI001CF1127B|nr:band 4.1-like protein 3 isoform X10 [Bufo gargarizans]